MKYSVIVGNIGQAFESEDKAEAMLAFDDWVLLSKLEQGKAANEPVTLMEDGEPIREYTPDPFAGSFMHPAIEHGEYFEVETENGTEIVPADVVCRLPFAVKFEAGGHWDASEDVPGWDALERAISPYVEGSSIQTISPKIGWLARMSAPGYMDCTDWTAHDSEAEAMAYLVDNYGNDN